MVREPKPRAPWLNLQPPVFSSVHSRFLGSLQEQEVYIHELFLKIPGLCWDGLALHWQTSKIGYSACARFCESATMRQNNVGWHQKDFHVNQIVGIDGILESQGCWLFIFPQFRKSRLLKVWQIDLIRCLKHCQNLTKRALVIYNFQGAENKQKNIVSCFRFSFQHVFPITWSAI